VHEEILQKQAQRPPCPLCGETMRRLYSVFGFKFDFRYGWDPGLGMYVDNKKQRETVLREKGLVREKDLGRFKFRKGEV